MTKEEFINLGWEFERSDYNPKFIPGNWHHNEKVESEWIFTKEVQSISLRLKFHLHRNETNIIGKYPDDNHYFTGKVNNLNDLKVIDRCITQLITESQFINTYMSPEITEVRNMTTGKHKMWKDNKDTN